MPSSKKKYRIILIISLIINLFIIVAYTSSSIINNIPDEYRMFKGEINKLEYKLPYSVEIADEDIAVFRLNNKPIDSKLNTSIKLSNSLKVSANIQGNYNVNVKLFGIFKVKEVQVKVVEHTNLVPLGSPVGIYVETDGILVLGTSSVTGEDGISYTPSDNKILTGDYIKKINDTVIRSKVELIKAINKCHNNPIKITILRNNKMKTVEIQPVKTADSYKIGVWVRDDIEGIGTLTYVDKDKGFGALGHGIEDVETSKQMTIKQGSIYEAEIVDVVKGKKGEPGELIGEIKGEANKVGEIIKNSKYGIFGKINLETFKDIEKQYYEIAFKQNVYKGDAYIISGITGKQKKYKIKVNKIDISNKNIKKGMEIEIVDEELLRLTNGIVQGMSGSPIIQDEKIIGAVTHVFVKDSTKGYGTFIENMLIEAEK